MWNMQDASEPVFQPLTRSNKSWNDQIVGKNSQTLRPTTCQEKHEEDIMKLCACDWKVIRLTQNLIAISKSTVQDKNDVSNDGEATIKLHLCTNSVGILTRVPTDINIPGEIQRCNALAPTDAQILRETRVFFGEICWPVCNAYVLSNHEMQTETDLVSRQWR